MGWSNHTVKFYSIADTPVLQGTITGKIFGASGMQERNRAGTGEVLLPETLTLSLIHI